MDGRERVPTEQSAVAFPGDLVKLKSASVASLMHRAQVGVHVALPLEEKQIDMKEELLMEEWTQFLRLTSVTQAAKREVKEILLPCCN